VRGVGRRTAIGALLAALAAALACSFSQPVPRPARYVLEVAQARIDSAAVGDRLALDAAGAAR